MNFLIAVILHSTLLKCSFVSGNPKAEGFSYPEENDIIVVDSEICDNEMTVSSCWTLDSLYFKFEVRDTNLQAYCTRKDSPKLFLDDMVEFLLDCNFDRNRAWLPDDIIYHINILGYKKDDRGLENGKSDSSWDGKAEYDIVVRGTVNDDSDKDLGYTVIVAIPWDEIGHTPKKGLKMGVNFVCGDNDGNGRQLLKWCPSETTRDTGTFGVIILN